MPRKRHKNKRYSPELKIAVVEAYLSGKGSMAELAKEYGLSAGELLFAFSRKPSIMVLHLSQKAKEKLWEGIVCRFSKLRAGAAMAAASTM